MKALCASGGLKDEAKRLPFDPDTTWTRKMFEPSKRPAGQELPKLEI